MSESILFRKIKRELQTEAANEVRMRDIAYEYYKNHEQEFNSHQQDFNNLGIVHEKFLKYYNYKSSVI